MVNTIVASHLNLYPPEMLKTILDIKNKQKKMIQPEFSWHSTWSRGSGISKSLSPQWRPHGTGQQDGGVHNTIGDWSLDTQNVVYFFLALLPTVSEVVRDSVSRGPRSFWGETKERQLYVLQ